MKVTMLRKHCPECDREYRAKDMARHIRSCRLRMEKRRNELHCNYCSRTFNLYGNAKRHKLTCKAKGKYVDQTKTSNTSDTEQHLLVEMLQKKDIELSQTRQELARKDIELAETRQILAKKEVELARKDTELAKKDLALVVLQAEKRSAPVHNHNYYTYAIHMTPWGIDPASPTYEGSLDADVREIRPLMDKLTPLPSLDEFVDLDDCEKIRHSRPRQKVLFDTMRDGINLEKPRYIVLDCARQKGLFTSPDGSVKVDPRMSLLMEHQRKIAVATTGHRGWYFQKGTPPLAQFHDMVATNGRNGALRLAKLRDEEEVIAV